jgi:C-terminal processing protease CtpA/Prc
VVEVMSDSPAAAAGLRPEDLIVAVDAQPVAQVDEIQRLLVGDRIGATVSRDVIREGRPVELLLVTAELELYSRSRKRRMASFASSPSIDSASQSRAWPTVSCQEMSRHQLSCCFV